MCKNRLAQNGKKHQKSQRKGVFFDFRRHFEQKAEKICGKFESFLVCRKFKKTTQYTPMSYIKEKRLEKAKELLHRSDMNISQIALASGFKTVHYFSKVFYESTGIRPSDYRNSINGV